MKNKAAIEAKKNQLLEMTDSFCDSHLDEDYKRLCVKLIEKMSRKRNVPFLSGRIEIWASAIIYALGSINFLFDRSFEPYVCADDICDYFRSNKSTVSQKAKVIRDMFRMQYYDDNFSTTVMMEKNPFDKLVVVNGLVVPINSLPPEILDLILEERRKLRDDS